VVGAALLSVSPAAPAVVSTEFIAEADTYVTSLHPSSNRGNEPELKADADPQRTIYLRFNVSGVTEESSVALKLWVEKKTRRGMDVRSVSEPWNELEITFENAPAPGPVGAVTGALPREDWIIVDVSPLVRTNGVVSLALTTANENSIKAASREAGDLHAPRLIVTNPLSPFTVRQEGTTFVASSPGAMVTYTASSSKS
jgi:hypothetical protein